MAVAVLDPSIDVAAQSPQKLVAARSRLQHLLLQTVSSIPPARLLPAASKAILLQSRIQKQSSIQRHTQHLQKAHANQNAQSPPGNRNPNQRDDEGV